MEANQILLKISNKFMKISEMQITLPLQWPKSIIRVTVLYRKIFVTHFDYFIFSIDVLVSLERDGNIFLLLFIYFYFGEYFD